MEKNILHLNENEINELLYYYEQGIIIGMEEIILKVIEERFTNVLLLEFVQQEHFHKKDLMHQW